MQQPYQKHEQIINGHAYEIMPFPGRYGLSMMAQLSKYAANIFRLIPSLSSGSVSMRNVLDSALSSNTIDSVIETLQSSLDDPKLVDLLFSLVKYVSRDGKPLQEAAYFDLVFAENYEEFFVLIKEVIVINFLSQSFMRNLFAKMTIKNPTING